MTHVPAAPCAPTRMSQKPGPPALPRQFFSHSRLLAALRHPGRPSLAPGKIHFGRTPEFGLSRPETRRRNGTLAHRIAF